MASAMCLFGCRMPNYWRRRPGASIGRPVRRVEVPGERPFASAGEGFFGRSSGLSHINRRYCLVDHGDDPRSAHESRKAGAGWRSSPFLGLFYCTEPTTHHASKDIIRPRRYHDFLLFLDTICTPLQTKVLRRKIMRQSGFPGFFSNHLVEPWERGRGITHPSVRLDIKTCVHGLGSRTRDGLDLSLEWEAVSLLGRLIPKLGANCRVGRQRIREGRTRPVLGRAWSRTG